MAGDEARVFERAGAVMPDELAVLAGSSMHRRDAAGALRMSSLMSIVTVRVACDGTPAMPYAVWTGCADAEAASSDAAPNASNLT